MHGRSGRHFILLQRCRMTVQCQKFREQLRLLVRQSNRINFWYEQQSDSEHHKIKSCIHVVKDVWNTQMSAMQPCNIFCTKPFTLLPAKGTVGMPRRALFGWGMGAPKTLTLALALTLAALPPEFPKFWIACRGVDVTVKW